MKSSIVLGLIFLAHTLTSCNKQDDPGYQPPSPFDVALDESFDNISTSCWNIEKVRDVSGTTTVTLIDPEAATSSGFLNISANQGSQCENTTALFNIDCKDGLRGLINSGERYHVLLENFSSEGSGLGSASLRIQIGTSYTRVYMPGNFEPLDMSLVFEGLTLVEASSSNPELGLDIDPFEYENGAIENEGISIRSGACAPDLYASNSISLGKLVIFQTEE